MGTETAKRGSERPTETRRLEAHLRRAANVLDELRAIRPQLAETARDDAAAARLGRYAINRVLNLIDDLDT